MELRTQAAAALLTVGLTTAALAAVLTWWQASGSLLGAQMDQAHASLQADVVAYAATYGSWEEATQAESLVQYLQRARNGGRPLDRRDALFALLDTSGRVVLDAGPFILQQVIAPDARRGLRPVQVNGEVVLQALPVSEPRPDPRSRATRAAIGSAMWTGLGVSALAAALLAFGLAGRLSARLRSLVDGLKLLQAEGEQRRRLPITGDDDVATLARALNDMADELGRTHTRMREAEATARRQAEELVELSVRDPLTGLFNRRHFDEQVRTQYHQAIRHSRPLCLALIDLDNFKLINDEFSHAMGDLVLKRVGQVLDENVRKSDIVARFSSGQFVVVYPESSLDQTGRRCEILRRTIETYPWHEINSRLNVTVSIGISDGVALGDVEKMIGEADARLYGARLGGGNRVEPATANEPA